MTKELTLANRTDLEKAAMRAAKRKKQQIPLTEEELMARAEEIIRRFGLPNRRKS